jgi:hypothetical protein
MPVKKRRVLIPTAILILVAVIVTGWPRRSDLWLRICIRDHDWERLKDVTLTMSDRSQNVLIAKKLDLHTDYDNGRRQLCGISGWYADAAKHILDASRDGMTVTIEASHCKRQQFAINRRDIESDYDAPRIQVGGHGTGVHAAAMHYRASHTLDLACEFATP